jgi:hypothetical protein
MVSAVALSCGTLGCQSAGPNQAQATWKNRPAQVVAHTPPVLQAHGNRAVIDEVEPGRQRTAARPRQPTAKKDRTASALTQLAVLPLVMWERPSYAADVMRK